MIVGIGCDLANINRFEKALAKFGGRFVNRAFFRKGKGGTGAAGTVVAERTRLCGGQTICRQGSLYQGAGNRFPRRDIYARH